MHAVFQTTPTRFLGSDNASSVHPIVMDALIAANSGHVASYGGDIYTQTAEKLFDHLFGRHVRPFFVYNGTGANSTALSALLHPYHSVLCAETSHIYYDECGAPEHITGSKLQPISSLNGKIVVEQLEPYVAFQGNMHHAQPRVISITQATELGTVYTPQEIRAIAEFAHAHHMYVHMDGARIANAIARVGCTIADMTWKAGVDVLSFGGTKNGLMFGEAVVFFDDKLGKDFPFVRKNCAQLASKMRYIAAQYIALLENDLWLHNASHANKMAVRLAEGVASIASIRLVQKVEANELFLQVPIHAIEQLRERCFFYTWDERQHVIRLVTSWDTQEEDVDLFLRACSSLSI